MTEYKFVQNFVSVYSKNNGIDLAYQPKGKNQSRYADCEIIYQESIIKLECKLLKDTRTNSSNFYNMLGEIIGTSAKICMLQVLKKPYKSLYNGFLIPSESEKTFAALWRKNITGINGTKYCRLFMVKYLVLFDHLKKTYAIKEFCAEQNQWV